MAERILIERFEANVSEKGIKFTIDNKGIVLIKDHSTDKIIGMINLYSEAEYNMEIAEKVIEAIEDWIVEHEN